jgi:hypothetical protein
MVEMNDIIECENCGVLLNQNTCTEKSVNRYCNDRSGECPVCKHSIYVWGD